MKNHKIPKETIGFFWRMKKAKLIKRNKKMTKSKWIDNRTYIPLEGKEKGVTHYLFNKNILRKEFRNFKIHTIWIEPRNEEEKKKRKSWESYYCLLAEKQS